MANSTSKSKHIVLKETASVFLKLGCIAFGGPAVHISMMEEEVVRKRQWMTHEHFLDLMGATNLIPGPNSTEMAIHCGRERGGWKGLLVAGCCFIMPAVIITGLFAWAYQVYGSLPEVQPFIYGIKPAIIAVIFSAAFRLARKAAKNITLILLGLFTLGASLAGVNEIICLFGACGMGILLYAFQTKGNAAKSTLPLLVNGPVSAWKVGWIFLKVGAILYGSGYVLFAFLESELVNKGLLSHQVLADAIAVGQFTPGPVFSSATFIGWQMGGLPGAAAATLGIFLPSFLFVALLNPLIPFLRRSGWMSAFLDAINIASVALILAVCFFLAKESVTDWRTILIAALGAVAALGFPKLNTAFVVLGGALLGWILSLL